MDLFDVFNAVLYELRTGAQWRQLPHDFPKWQTVYTYFAMWSKPLANSESSMIDLLLKKLSFESDYEWDDRYVILDAQSVKNTAIPQNKGYNGGKKISGIKWL